MAQKGSHKLLGLSVPESAENDKPGLWDRRQALTGKETEPRARACHGTAPLIKLRYKRSHNGSVMMAYASMSL